MRRDALPSPGREPRGVSGVASGTFAAVAEDARAEASSPPMSTEDPDRLVLARIAGGEVAAVGDLYDRYAGILLGLAVRILHDRTEAEDVVHDAFVHVADRASLYAPERGAVRPWLVTLVRNLCIDRVRRRASRTRGAQVLAEPAARPASPESLTSDAAERRKIRLALASLPEAARATLEIAFFEGLTYPEIAARESVPVGTIKSRAARGLALLREALAREGVTAVLS
jgi:RNA polymerase sigma-70 factor (ECF subfamily)